MGQKSFRTCNGSLLRGGSLSLQPVSHSHLQSPGCIRVSGFDSRARTRQARNLNVWGVQTWRLGGPNLETLTFGGSKPDVWGVQTWKPQRLGGPNLETSTFGGSKPDVWGVQTWKPQRLGGPNLETSTFGSQKGTKGLELRGSKVPKVCKAIDDFGALLNGCRSLSSRGSEHGLPRL